MQFLNWDFLIFYRFSFLRVPINRKAPLTKTLSTAAQKQVWWTHSMPNFIQHAKFYLFAEFKNISQQRFLPYALIVKLFFASFIPNKKPLDRIPNILRQTRTRGQPSRVFPLIIRVSILSTSLFLTPKVVRQATGKCFETKVRKTREV